MHEILKYLQVLSVFYDRICGWQSIKNVFLFQLIVSDRYALAMAGYISPDSYLQFVEEVTGRMLAELVEGQSVPEYAVWNVVVASLRSVDDILCELALGDDVSPSDVALRANLREFARDLLRRALRFVVDDVDDPFGSDHAQCPDGADCNVLQSVLLKALVALDDRAVVTAAFEAFYECSNRVCEDQERCSGL